MIKDEVRKRIREIEIHTQRALSSTQVGGHHALTKGFGFNFDQLRGYQYGDDVRLIDWKSSARSDSLLVRQYFEERNCTFMICVDVSASTRFASQDYMKQEVIQQVAAVLALVAFYGQDRVGLILFSDQIEEVVAPGKTYQHVHSLIDKLFFHKAQSKKTDMSVLLDYVAIRIPKHSVVFVVSDFIASNYQENLRMLAMHKEVIALSCADKQEYEVASVGLVWMKDPETGDVVLVDTGGKSVSRLNKGLSERMKEQKKLFQKYRVDVLQLTMSDTFVNDLVLFFRKRLMY